MYPLHECFGLKNRTNWRRKSLRAGVPSVWHAVPLCGFPALAYHFQLDSWIFSSLKYLVSQQTKQCDSCYIVTKVTIRQYCRFSLSEVNAWCAIVFDVTRGMFYNARTEKDTRGQLSTVSKFEICLRNIL